MTLIISLERIVPLGNPGVHVHVDVVLAYTTYINLFAQQVHIHPNLTT